MNLNLTHLMNFIHVVEWANISKAAAYLNIAQPALSRQMQALEAALNTKLLQRQNWGIEPTEDGRLLLEHARRIQKECMDVQESVRSNRENPAGSVHLGVPSAYAVSLVPPLVKRMRERYPGIEVHVVEGFSSAIFEWLVSGRLNLAILYRSKQQVIENGQPFFHEELVALTSPQHGPAVSILGLAELADKKLIAPWRPHFLRLLLEESFARIGVTPELRLEIDSLRCMIELAQQGEGIAILPPSCVAREISDGRLRPIPLRPSLRLNTVIGHTPGRQPSRAVGILSQVLQEVVMERAPELGWSMDTA